jgi:hypothetical protein
LEHGGFVRLEVAREAAEDVERAVDVGQTLRVGV